MRFPVVLIFLLIASPALAHPTHIERAGGHSHWFGFAAAGLVLIALSVWFAARPVKPAASDG